MPPRKLYFENVRLGDELPAMARAPIERVQLARYAGATGDFNPLHVDEVSAKAQGMPSVLVPNTLGMGFLAQLVGDWARGAQVKRLACRFSRTICFSAPLPTACFTLRFTRASRTASSRGCSAASRASS